MYTTMAMYTTINPSVTITPVYKTAKEKCKVAVSSVTVQVEPVDLSVRPAQDSRPGPGLWSFIKSGPASPAWEEKEEKTREWCVSKKIHRCTHPGCEKVRNTTQDSKDLTTNHHPGLHQELTPQGSL